VRKRVCDLFFFFLLISLRFRMALWGGVSLGSFADGRRGGFGAGGGDCEVAGWDSEWEDGGS